MRQIYAPWCPLARKFSRRCADKSAPIFQGMSGSNSTDAGGEIRREVPRSALRRFVLKDNAITPDSTFLHPSALPEGIFDRLDHKYLLSYKVEPNPIKPGSVRACNINIFRRSALI
jgi:hypothetical protein